MNKKEFVGYAAGGVGHNLIYALFSGYLLIYYTDVFGLPASFIAILFLVARIFDAVNDPVMGMIADRTNSRFGHYRIWIMIASPVIALALILCFFTPNLTQGLQYVYCYVTYILLGMSFTCADIPYWSLPSVMTADAQKRAKVFSVGSVAACLASGVGAVAVPMIISGSDNAKDGYLFCAVWFAVIGVVCYMLCAALTREQLSVERKNYSFKVAVGTLVKNKPLLILMAASLFGNLSFQIKVAMNTYYGQYSLGKYEYITYLSAMLLVGMLIGSVLVPVMIKKFGAKGAMNVTLAGGILISLVYFAIGYADLVIVLVFSALSAVVIGAFSVLVNSITADTIDYAELHLGQRNEGMITSTRTFITKVATAIAGAVSAFALDIIGYVPNAEQTREVKNAFHTFMSLIPAVLYTVAFVIMLGYPVTKQGFLKLQEDLQKKRG